MPGRVFNVLFLCTGNSARSILAESLINRRGQGGFRGFSAGSHPSGQLNPMALDLLRRLEFPIEHLRSKSWREFEGPAAPHMDFVFTVCDNAAAEQCPIWSGHPMTAHWGVADPAAVAGDEKERMLAFERAFSELENRVQMFVSLPFDELEGMKLQNRLNEIGRSPPATE